MPSAPTRYHRSISTGSEDRRVRANGQDISNHASCTNAGGDFVSHKQLALIFRKRSTVSGSMVKWTGKQIPNRKRQKGYKPKGS